MTTHTPTPPTTTGTTGRVLGLTLGGVLLLAVVAVSIGTWQGAQPRAAAVNPVSTRARSAPDAATVMAVDSVAREPQRYLYLTASDEVAAHLRQLLLQLNALRTATGQQMYDAGVVVLPADDHSPATGLPMPPGTIVIDLRTAGARTPAAGAPAPTTTGGLAPRDGERATGAGAVEPTVYLVESEERAQALQRDMRRAIDDQNGFLALQGQPPLEARVVWFDSAEAEVQFWVMWDGLRLEQGGREGFAVVDLRGR
jgi:hypothetical protein